MLWVSKRKEHSHTIPPSMMGLCEMTRFDFRVPTNMPASICRRPDIGSASLGRSCQLISALSNVVVMFVKHVSLANHESYWAD